MDRGKSKNQTTNKVGTLKKYHALNPHPEKVKDKSFLEGAPFFDPRDLVQVKYEMLRQAKKEKRSVTDVAASFGFSRPSFYQARDAFEQRGLPGLLPQKPGPIHSHKLGNEVMEFIDRIIIDNGSVTMPTFRMYDPNGEWFKEGHGVDPDIKVLEDFQKLANGTDVQLDAGIKEVLKLLNSSNRFKIPTRPSYEKRD